MSADLLQTISVVAFLLAGLFVVVSVILYFQMDVRGIVNDLTGKAAEREIRELREQNRKPEMNRRGNTLFDGTTEQATLKSSFARKRGTESITLSVEEGTELLTEEGTALLQTEEGTTLLSEEHTALLPVEEGTMLLTPHYQLLMDEIVIHTKEII